MRPFLAVSFFLFVSSPVRNSHVSVPASVLWRAMSTKRITKTKTTTHETEIKEKSPVAVLSNGTVRITVHVKPNARLSQITDISDEYVSIQLAAPPRDGEANDEVVNFMRELFGLPGRSVELVHGGKSRLKTVELRFSTVDNAFNSTDAVMGRLRSSMQ